MKNSIKLFSLALIGAIIFSCNSDPEAFPSSIPVPATTNVAKTLKTIPSLSLLSDAVEKAELSNVLAATGVTFTLLAPSNSALEAHMKKTPYGSVKYAPKDYLKGLLINHLLVENIQSSSLIGSSGYTKTQAETGGSEKIDIYYNGEGNVITFNGEAAVTTPDIKAKNGTIHIVDAIIKPATIATFVAADPNYSSLLAALTRDSDFPYVPALSGGTFTVFAPTNDAFGALLKEKPLKATDLGQLPKAFLQSTIENHVTTGNIKSTNITDGMTINTLDAQLTANIAGNVITLTDPKTRKATIIAPINIQARNGVIHTIDKVLVKAFPSTN